MKHKPVTFRDAHALLARIVRKAISKGFSLSLGDGEFSYKPTKDVEKILRVACEVDSGSLSLRDKDGAYRGSLIFVFDGPEMNIVVDHTECDEVRSVLCDRSTLAADGIDVSWWEE